MNYDHVAHCDHPTAGVEGREARRKCRARRARFMARYREYYASDAEADTGYRDYARKLAEVVDIFGAARLAAFARPDDDKLASRP